MTKLRVLEVKTITENGNVGPIFRAKEALRAQRPLNGADTGGPNLLGGHGKTGDYSELQQSAGLWPLKPTPRDWHELHGLYLNSGRIPGD